jgi:hypothetical protein
MVYLTAVLRLLRGTIILNECTADMTSLSLNAIALAKHIAGALIRQLRIASPLKQIGRARSLDALLYIFLD